jgi:putative endonuclease
VNTGQVAGEILKIKVMIGYVYILKSLKNGRYYIGSTNDWLRRKKEHITGSEKYTRLVLPLEVALVQKFDSLILARRTEYWLKRQKDRSLLEKIIADGKINKKV